MRLDNKVARITGAASGIGREIAIPFAREGAKVAIADLDPRASDATASESEPCRARAIGVGMDVTDGAQVEAGTAQAVAAFGSLDGLHGDAGIQIVAPLVDFEGAAWRTMRAIHLDGAFLTTRAAPRQMYRRKSRSIIYMASARSKEASLLRGPYVTAKHVLIGLAKVLAREGAEHGVRVNVICPGFARTPLDDERIPGQAKALGISEQAVIGTVPLKDTVDHAVTTIADVAEAALFPASFPTNALTGQSLILSHGWFLR